MEDIAVAMSNLSILKYEDWYEVPRSHLLAFSNKAYLARQYHAYTSGMRPFVCCTRVHLCARRADVVDVLCVRM